MVAGDRRALSRLISLIENQSPRLMELMPKIHTLAKGKAVVLGITGPPGAGKSTVVDQLTKLLRKEKARVAILAIDPSSPFSGGAVLGDRIRMQSHAGDLAVFIRSLGSRGSFGGLSRATKQIGRLLDAAQFDFIIIETVGVGQTELSIMEIARTTVVILVPESGDTIQTMKAGLLEIADIFIVNKSDRPGADQMQFQLKEMVGLPESVWKIPVLKTDALHGKGIQEVWKGIKAHGDYLKKDVKGLHEKREKELRAEFLEIILFEFKKQLLERKDKTTRKLFSDVESGRKDPYTAASEIIYLHLKKIL